MTGSKAKTPSGRSTETKPRAKRGEYIRRYFTAQRIATLAMLTAIGYALSFLEFTIFPPASFLKMDFSNVATMLGGYMLGPVGAIVIEGVKQALCLITSTSGGVGQLANFMVTVCFIIVPSVLYKFKKGLPWVAAGMGVGCVLQVAASLVANRYINFPLYMGDQAAEMFSSLFPFIIAFNVIKGVAISALTLLLYKRLSKAMKWLFRDRKKSAKAGEAEDNDGKSFAKNEKEVYNDGMQKTITRSEDETRAFARGLAENFKGGEVVLLNGDLGAGKTVFAKGVAEALGVKEDVKSPTFTLSCEYEGRLRLVHIDAYRLKNGEEAEACGIGERFGDKSAVCLVEWPSQIESILPAHAIEVTIERTGDNEREITVKC
ncbi:MAG TPA: tRNA (adenosine(37)-N6)-threonylcarbamoyltransferase complex ATPase subunit type 1 TsaE [Candidatus Protoclostridium stercorigallinarum]|uniref:tRNA threonylcarbamoyladenosine biosynthesis protein TsaE n=1 Tax=Candidatus Protoclostridium stercorigallinarum TaxID=2838741 RepID=A0A9D1PZ83_9FIRM|nr:tRNA (adenosine(37)-N6)-threonylcarbamoyltransferase complex ATPase subunit type 1 TsaE [Candidatus Protoclostridium stercorigallinarum]